jgi:hypothetical protein
MTSKVSLRLAVALMLVSAWVGAAATESRALDFFEQSGLRAQMESAKAAEAQQAKEVVQAMVGQMRSQLPELPAGAGAEIEKATLDMVEAMADAYTVQELLEVYAAPFDRAYPNGFADEAEMFSTPDGQRFIATLNEAIAATYAFRSQRQQAVMNRETQRFVERLRALAAPRAP